MQKKCQTNVSIEQAQAAMGVLLNGHSPSLLQAFRNAALSSRMALINNAGYAIVLRKYHDRPLPDRNETVVYHFPPSPEYPNGLDKQVCVLEAELRENAIRQDGSGKPAWNLMSSHVDTLYAIDALFFSGTDVSNYGGTFEEQSAWRDTMVASIRGMGMKLVSWALFIYDPLGCKLLTIDCHHAARIGISQEDIARGTKKSQQFYRDIEQRVMGECLELHPRVSPVITAAMLWLNYRQEGLTDHCGISCRVTWE